MTPQQIATQARQTYLKQMQDYCGAYRQDPPDLDALILTAAAKMVRESGAVEAFKLLVNEDNYLEPSFDPCEEARAALAKLRAITEGKA